MIFFFLFDFKSLFIEFLVLGVIYINIGVMKNNIRLEFLIKVFNLMLF